MQPDRSLVVGAYGSSMSWDEITKSALDLLHAVGML